MKLAADTVDRSLGPQRERYEREVELLVGSALRVLRRKGYAAATVADVLEEAELSTRAFYRHFHSKEELFLAVFERDSVESSRRMQKRLAPLPGPRARLLAWIDEVLSLAYDRPRARRTRTLANQASGLRSAYPSEFVAIERAVYEPLVAVLEEGCADGSFPAAHPEEDARSIHAVTWGLAQAQLGGGGPPDLESARAHVLRFCLPALGDSVAASDASPLSTSQPGSGAVRPSSGSGAMRPSSDSGA
jgi:AcrR family transcriptional regulator